MRILFLDAYFEPEQIAFTHLEKDLLEGLIEAGHEIEIICPTPTRGVTREIEQKYKSLKKETLYNGHVHVTRFLAPREGKNPLIRALRYLWCNLCSYQIGKKMKNIDAIFANSTPPTQGWMAGLVAKKHKVPFIYSLQDIFPDSLVTTGLSRKGSILWRIGRRLEKITYNGCSIIIVISEAMRNNLLQKGIEDKKIRVISNWIDLEEIHPIAREDNQLFEEFGISRDKFIVLYAGNFGAAQGAEIVLDVAERIQNDIEIQFVIFGGGTGFSEAEEKAMNLSNVFIHHLLPQDRVADVYSMGDVALITCKKGVGKSGMPSKTWSIMACNTPIIASFDLDSEMEKVLLESESGVIVEPENSTLLLSEIIREKNNSCGKKKNSREFVLNNASKKICVKKYIDAFEEA